MKVIIIDDSTSVRKAVRDLLQRHEDIIIAGDTGSIRDGLRLIYESTPDAIILDLSSPRGSGLILLSIVKATMPACKVIVLSNVVGEQFRNEAMLRGANHFLDKAFDFEKLIEAIRN